MAEKNNSSYLFSSFVNMFQKDGYGSPSRISNGSVGRQNQIVTEPEGFVPLLSAAKPNYYGDGSKSTKQGPPPLQEGVDYINAREEDQMEIYGYKPHFLYTFVTWFAIVLSAGLLRLVFHWHPEWMLYCTHVRCCLENASKVLLVTHYKQLYVEDVRKMHPEDVSLQAMTSVISNVTKAESDQSVLKNSHLTATYLFRPGQSGEFYPTDNLTYFDNNKVRYLWDSSSKQFSALRGLDRKVPCSFFHRQKGLSAADQSLRRILYGENEIVVEVQSIPGILFQEVLEPFYIFQVFSVVIWYLDDYVYYASCIILMSAVSLVTSVYQIRKNQTALRDTVHATDIVTVCRGKGVYEQIPSQHLVPGDVIELHRHGCFMHCDAVLLTGSCIVNESILTGESVPVTKTPLPLFEGNDEISEKSFHPKEHARHTLFCGTRVIQTRYYDTERVKAIVIRTGFQTAKGELVRSIMFPKPVDFKFNRHIHKFIACLAGLASVGFLYTVILKAQRHVPAQNIAIRALDLITIVIPPALPAAMTIGIVFAQQRLKKSKIYCISPRSINISGCINCVCFDKTGTLTEEGLDMWGVVPVQDGRFVEPEKQPSRLSFCPILVGMATCHSLTVIDKELSGDPLDLKMFESTEWELNEPDIDDTAKYDIITPTVVHPKQPEKYLTSNRNSESPLEIGIIRQFPFSSSLQRMSVIVRILGAKNFDLHTKGAPETIASLCDPDSVPTDFSKVLMLYTQQGHRVLALAYKPLSKISYAKAQRISREELESNLVFLGLLVLENRLKPETVSVLEVLKDANIRTIMVTGDNMLTALSVARDCGMIEKHHQVLLLTSSKLNDDNIPTLSWCYSSIPDEQIERETVVHHQDKVSIKVETQEKFHIALTGNTFAALRDYYPNLLKKVAINGTVFSRMAPDQKQQLIELLQELGYYVGMCGDGANDCGALKAAHAGISLSEAEASVASPFTSRTPNISCVPTLIREGRAALVTSFGILKYMACYSLTQFVSVIILYTLYSNLTDFEFLYVDLFLITLFAALFGRTEAYPHLVKKPPPSSLIGFIPLTSLLSQIFLVAVSQLLAVFILWQQPWYKPHKPKEDDSLKCHDNFAVFAVSVFQYITLVVIFSKGAPYRKSMSSNVIFLSAVLVMVAFSVYLVLNPHYWLSNLFDFDLEGVTWDFRIILIAIAAGHFIIAFFTESFIVGYLLFHKCQGKLCHQKKSMEDFIAEEGCDPDLLPISESPTETTLIHSATVTSAFSGSNVTTPSSELPNLEVEGSESTKKVESDSTQVNVFIENGFMSTRQGMNATSSGDYSLPGNKNPNGLVAVESVMFSTYL